MTKTEMEQLVSKLLLEQREFRRLGTELPPDKLLLLRRLLFRLGLTRMSRNPKPRRYSTQYTHVDFHNAINAEPAEKTNALAYADFLEENGKPSHAAIIRSHTETVGDAVHSSPASETTPNVGEFRVVPLFSSHKNSKTHPFSFILHTRDASDTKRSMMWLTRGMTKEEARNLLKNMDREGAISEPNDLVRRKLRVTKKMTRSFLPKKQIRFVKAEKVRAWQLPSDTVRGMIENASSRDDLSKIEMLLRDIWPEWTETPNPDTENDYAYTAWRAANRGDEIPRLPFNDFHRRHRRAVERALQSGQTVEPSVTADHPGLVADNMERKRRRTQGGLLRLAKAEKDRHPAHALIEGFPLEHALRQMANDPKRSSHVRELAKHALTKGDTTALWGLHDATQEDGHGVPGGYNLMSAADKIQHDQHTYTALTELTNHIRKQHNIPSSNKSWDTRPEYLAQRTALSVNKNDGHMGRQEKLLNRNRLNWVKNRVKELSPYIDDKQIDESIQRHAHRAGIVWRKENEIGGKEDQRRAVQQHEGLNYSGNAPKGFKENEKATRYRRLPKRRYAINSNSILRPEILKAMARNGHEYAFGPQTNPNAGSEHPLMSQLLSDAASEYKKHGDHRRAVESVVNRHFPPNRIGRNDTQKLALTYLNRSGDNIEEIPPTKRYGRLIIGAGEPLMGGADFMHEISDEGGNRVGHVWVTPMEGGTRLHVNHVGAMGHEANSLGPSVIRDAMRQLRTHYPDAKRITGTRITGAVKKNTGGDRPTERKMQRLPKRRFSMSNRGNFIDSLRKIQSSNQQAMHETANRLAKQLGMEPTKVLNALHDTPHGSVPGIAQAVYGPASPEQLHAAAAWIGLTSNVPGVAVFHTRPMGPDTLYRMRQDGAGLDIRSKLDRHGIRSRILIPNRRGFDIIVPDKGNQLGERVNQYAETHGLKVEASPGHFNTIGSADQARSREMFRSKVEQQERMSRKGRPKMYTLDINETIRQGIRNSSRNTSVNGSYIQNADAGGVLADALDEAGHPHAPFYRNLILGSASDKAMLNARDGRYAISVYGHEHLPSVTINNDNSHNWQLLPGLSDTNREALVVHRLSGGITHTAVMHSPALREWAGHPDISEKLRDHLLRSAEYLEKQEHGA